MDADSTRDELRVCLGAVARDCVESGGQSTAEMRACAGREAQAWQVLIDEYAATLRVRETPNQTASLNAFLAGSEAWGQARCHYQASLYEGGSLAGLVASFCARDNRAEAAIDLRARLNEYGQR
jgi:uncharacterized protein YecT (DUF1311 family)